MRQDNNNISISFQIVLIIESSALTWVLSNYEKSSKILIKYLHYDWSISLLIVSFFLLIFATTCIFFTNGRIHLRNEEIDEYINDSKITINSKHVDFRKNILTKKFNTINEDVSSLRLALPSGNLIGGYFNLWIEDIYELANIIEIYIDKSTILSINNKKLHNELHALVHDILNKNKLDIIEKYFHFIDDPFMNLSQEYISNIKDNFSKISSSVTDKKISHLSSLINLKKVT